MKKLWMQKAGIFLYVMLQCTWGVIQTGLGLLVFLRCWSCPHHNYRGAVHTEWEGSSGVSLGLFFFTPRLEAAGQRGPAKERSRRMRVHEYGHTVQSLLLGPFYLIVIGLPSLVWSRSKRLGQWRKEKGIPYSFFYTERWADWLGERMTGERSDGA